MRAARRAVGAVALDGSGRLLLVRRAHEPSAGLWSVPGGKVEPGEDDVAAVVREVSEETGLDVRVDRLLGEVEIAAAGLTLEVRDYACTVTGGTAVAGSDATELRWAGLAELRTMTLVPGLLDALTRWGALPR